MHLVDHRYLPFKILNCQRYQILPVFNIFGTDNATLDSHGCSGILKVYSENHILFFQKLCDSYHYNFGARKRQIPENTPTGNTLNKNNGLFLNDTDFPDRVWSNEDAVFPPLCRVDIRFKKLAELFNEIIRRPLGIYQIYKNQIGRTRILVYSGYLCRHKKRDGLVFFRISE